MASEPDPAMCGLCMKLVGLANLQDISHLGKKGCLRINEATKGRILDLLKIKHTQNNRLYVHKECRRLHTHPSNVRATHQRSIPTETLPDLRFHATAFDFKQKCVFCPKIIDTQAAYKYQGNGHYDSVV